MRFKIMLAMRSTRRELLSIPSLLSITVFLPRLSSAKSPASDLRINSDRLRASLEALSLYGRPPGSTFADGVSRVAFSDADVAGRNYVMQLMRGFAMEPRIDPAGNIFGSRAGSHQNLKPVLFGSHIDSVPNGGNFDGDLGSLAAIEVIQRVNETGTATRRTLEVVVWCNEEGVAFNDGLYGSRAAAGLLAPGELDQTWNGVLLRTAVRKVGGDPEHIESARRARGS